MIQIYKYPLQVSKRGGNTAILELPKQAKFLGVRTEDFLPMIFFMLDPELEKWSRKFCIYRIGEKIYHKDLVLLGNYMIHTEDNVFFLFEDRSHISEKTLQFDRKAYRQSKPKLTKRVGLSTGTEDPNETETE